MQLSEIRYLKQKANANQFVSFTYVKENGEKSKRVVRLGGDIAKRMIKQNTPINGRGNWLTSDRVKKEGKNSFLIRRGGKVYLRGTEVNGTESKHKIFALNGVSDLK